MPGETPAVSAEVQEKLARLEKLEKNEAAMGYKLRSWERLGVPVDPRKSRFEKVQAADMDLMLRFHKAHIKGRVKLISVVGDTTRMDMKGLAKIAKPVAVGLDDIFVF